MKNNLLLFILIVSLQGTNTELNAPDHFGTVSNAMVHSVFGDQSIILLDHELGSAHRVFPENDPYKDHINLLERTKKYIADSPEIFRNQVNEIKLEVFEKRGIVDYVIYRQTYEQVPVYQSRINFRYSNNNLVWFGADTYPNIAIDVHPQIDTKTALLLAEAELEFDLDNDDFLIDEPQLYIYAFSLGDYRLAWRLGLFIHHDDPDLYERSVSNYLVWVDAHSGDIFSIVDRVEEIEIQGSVTAMVKDVPYGMQRLRPIEDVKVAVSGVGDTYTDENGYYSIEAGTDQRTVSIELLGSYLNVNASNANDAYVSSTVTPGDTFNVHFDNLNSLAGERDTYFHANLIHDWIKNIDNFFDGVDYIMPAAVNIGSEDNLWPCNAYWNGIGINMFSTGGGCSATDQMADVIYHEYQHGITQFAYEPFDSPYTSGMGEGFSDYAGMTIRNSPCLGDAFYGTPGSCLRNGENTLQYPGDECGGSAHCLGQLSMGSLWQMRKNLITAFSDTAAAVAHSDSLFRFAMVGRPYSVPDLLIEVLTADDNDGYLLNGTPYFQEIIDGFAQHNVPSPLPAFGILHSPIQNMMIANDPIAIEAIILSLNSIIYTAEVVYSFGAVEISTAMAPGDEANEYIATIPAQPPGSVITYYIHAVDVNGNEYFSPETAPDIQHFFLIGNLASFPTLFSDDSESDQGWTLGISSDSATTGIWVREDPIGTTNNGQQLQPEDDHTIDGITAFVTGNAPFDGSNAGDDDVDNGATTLLTPVMNLTGVVNPVFGYWRWYSNNLGNAPNADDWVVQVTADGQSWIDLEHTSQSEASWFYKQFLLNQYITMSSQVQVRFIAEDGGAGSLVEAAIDDIFVLNGVNVDVMIGDVDFNGELSINDVLQLVDFILGFISPNGIQFYAGDINQDGNLNIIDALSLIQIILNP
jgi:Zn-dependent metalloprotease